MGMIGGLIGGAIGVGTAAYGIAHAAHQKNLAAKMMSAMHRPTYNIPGSQTAALNMAQSRYDDSSLPGQAALQNQLSANTSQGLTAAQQAAGSSGDVLDAVTKLYNNQNQGTINLGIQAAQNQNQNAAALSTQLGDQAQYEDKAWDYNQNQPYQQAMERAVAMQAAGEKGQNDSINGLGKSLSGVASSLPV